MYADLILPLALPMQTLSYQIPAEFESDVVVGSRVVVQVGKKKIYSAIVCNIHNNKPIDYETKPIISVIDSAPIINLQQLQFWQWLADYYMCNLGDVMRAALPSGLKMESETRISASVEEFSDDLTEKEFALYQIIERNKTLNLQQLADKSGKKNIIPALQSMLEKGAICVDENLKQSYKPRLETVVRLSKTIKNETNLNAVFDSLKRAKQQQNLLMQYLSLSPEIDFEQPLIVAKNELLRTANVGAAVLKSCVEKNIFQTETREIGRLKYDDVNTQKPSALSPIQQSAFDEINKNFETKNVVLLHGVTSSGKTEIYIKLIESVLQQGKQTLYLVPEIALTAQLVDRLKTVFGNSVGVYHSKYSDAERVEVYKNIINENASAQKYSIIIGARSALFLPFSNLGLIIVDEEHETSYKQYDSAPRYNARDAAIKLAQIHGAKTLLGTATPSIESYFNALQGKYGLVNLTERYGNVALPKAETASILASLRKRQMNGHFTKPLLDAINSALINHVQVILFQNRRGFSPFVQCDDCGEIPHCKHCNVTLTYHKNTNQLRCHYCGYSIPFPTACKACGSTNIQKKGFGTERIEDELAVIFPKARVARFDLDSTRTRNAYMKIISDFDSRKIDILVGTQMVAKGLDFGGVSVVGIMNADNMLNFPDFRAHERAFQLMTQVSGRAGRREKTGLVIIQTYNPENKTVRDVINNDFSDFYRRQIEERRNFCYPPFFRLISVVVKHRNVDIVNAAAQQLAQAMRSVFGARVLGPEAPVINRIQNKYLSEIVLKIEREKSPQQAKQFMRQIFARIQQQFKTVTIQVNVDP